MKNLILSLFVLAGLAANASEIITVTLTTTNSAVTSNTFALNGSTRTFTNAYSSTTILTNLTSIPATASNVAAALALYPVSGSYYSFKWLTATQLAFVGAPAQAMSGSVGGDWGYITLSTNIGTNAITVRVPVTIESAANQTNIGSGLVEAINRATNSFTRLNSEAFNLTNGSLSTVTAYDLNPLESVNGRWSVGTNTVGSEDSVTVGFSNTVANPSQVYLGIGNTETAGDNAGYNVMIGIRNSINNVTNAIVIGHGVAGEANTITLGDTSQKLSVPGGFKSSTFHSTTLTGTNLIGGMQLAGFTNDIPAGTACTLDIRTNSLVWVVQDGSFADATVVGISNSVPGMLVAIGNAAAAYSASVNVYITNESASASAAGYRVKTPDSRDIILEPGAIQLFIYDGGQSRWAPIGRPYATALELLTLNVGTAYLTNASIYAGSATNFNANGTKKTTFTPEGNSNPGNGNNTGVILGTNTYNRITGPTTIAAFGGFVAEPSGSFHVIQFSGGITNYLVNEGSGTWSQDATAGNRILTGTGGDIAMTNQPAMAILIYDGTSSRWRVVNHSR